MSVTGENKNTGYQQRMNESINKNSCLRLGPTPAFVDIVPQLRGAVTHTHTAVTRLMNRPIDP